MSFFDEFAKNLAAYDFKIKYKNESLFMKVIGFLLFFNKTFMTNYITTIGSTIYYPSREWCEKNDTAAAQVLGSVIGGGMSLVGKTIDAAQRNRAMRQQEIINKIKRKMMRDQAIQANIQRTAQARQGQEMKEMGLADRQRGLQQQEAAQGRQLSRQSMADVLGMINRNPQLRQNALRTMKAQREGRL